jgi:hypothetical protein
MNWNNGSCVSFFVPLLLAGKYNEESENGNGPYGYFTHRLEI